MSAGRAARAQVPVVTQVPVVAASDEAAFRERVYPSRRPAVLRGIDLGRAPRLWTAEYLCTKCGGRPVKVHVCPVAQADFIKKNFAYRTLPFDEFIRRASRDTNDEHFFCPEEKYYLRALGDDPRKDVADIHAQFPSLADDIRLPLFFPRERLFSSVLRVGSAGFQLWTHYDVMDNLLVQVCGHKRVILFSPREASNLYLSGDKSSVLDIDAPDLTAYPRFAGAERQSCVLEPGDALFIPALWFHNVTALEWGVAVNMFWQNLDSALYDPRDTYANHDPLPAQRAGQIVDRALKALEELPDEFRDFYARRLVARIETKAYSRQPVPHQSLVAGSGVDQPRLSPTSQGDSLT